MEERREKTASGNGCDMPEMITKRTHFTLSSQGNRDNAAITEMYATLNRETEYDGA